MPFRFMMIAAVLLAGCADKAPAVALDDQPSIEAPDGPMTAAEMDDVRAQIERNLNIDFDHPCDRPVSIRVTLAADGTVQKTELIEDSPGAACRAATESAIRAIRISSPLKLPADRHWTTMVLRFDGRL
jgi:hypothetical protein